MNKKNTIKNNSKSRRNFLENLGKWIGGTALLAFSANLLIPKKISADNPSSAVTTSNPFVGGIGMVGFNFAPRGWAFCDGQLIAVSQNDALFSLLGTIYGGDGRTTFGLPDLRGRIPIHAGTGPGLSPRRLGAKGGTENNTLTTNTMPSHNHSLRVNSGVGNSDDPSGKYLASNPEGINHYSSDSPNANAHSSSITNTGGSRSFNNMPPCLAVHYIIALFGVYPSRH